MTPEERFLFDLQGYVLVPDALQGKQLDEVRAAVVRVTGEQPEAPTSVPCAFQREPALLDLVEHEPVLSRIRQFVGPNPKLIDQDAMATPLTERGQGWHRGVGPWGYWADASGFACLMVKVIYYLTDIGPGDGPTRVIPGSHKQAVPFDLPYEADDAPGAVDLEVSAGTAFIFSEALLHAGSPNRTGKVRRMAIYNYGPSFMEIWQGYEPSRDFVRTLPAERRRLLGDGETYPEGAGDMALASFSSGRHA